MTLRDKIMDKYWMEFLADCSDYLHDKYGKQPDSAFWRWFFDNKVQNSYGELKDYL